MQVVAGRPSNLSPRLGVKSSKIAREIVLHASSVLQNEFPHKILELSGIDPQNCDFVGCYPQEILSIFLSIRVFHQSQPLEVLANVQAVAPYINSISTVAGNNLRFRFSGRTNFQMTSIVIKNPPIFIDIVAH